MYLQRMGSESTCFHKYLATFRTSMDRPNSAEVFMAVDLLQVLVKQRLAYKVLVAELTSMTFFSSSMFTVGHFMVIKFGRRGKRT